MTFAFGETVKRDRRRPVATPYNPARQTVPGWGDVTDEDLDTVELEGVYVADSSETAIPDAARSPLVIYKSLYSTDRHIDVKVGDRIRTEDDIAYYVNVRPQGDRNPFTGWEPGVEIPLVGEAG